MPEENLNQKNIIVKFQNFHKIIITQCICCVVIIICVVLVKYFDSDSYAKIRNLYSEYFCYDVSADEVLDSLTSGEK